MEDLTNYTEEELEDYLKTKDVLWMIKWLEWNDRNGQYSDEASDREGIPRLTKREGIEIIIRQVTDWR